MTILLWSPTAPKTHPIDLEVLMQSCNYKNVGDEREGSSWAQGQPRVHGDILSIKKIIIQLNCVNQGLIILLGDGTGHSFPGEEISVNSLTSSSHKPPKLILPPSQVWWFIISKESVEEEIPEIENVYLFSWQETCPWLNHENRRKAWWFLLFNATAVRPMQYDKKKKQTPHKFENIN